MRYEKLQKTFHIDETRHKRLYEARVSDPDAIHINVQIAGNPAFMVMDADVYRPLLRLAQADKRIRECTDMLPGKAIEQFTQKCLIDEVLITNEIEGVSSSRKEIGEVLDNIIDDSSDNKKKTRLFGLVNKYYMLGIDRKPIESPRDVRNLYDELVLDEVKAENPSNAPDGELFRKDGVTVYDKAGRPIHHGTLTEDAITSEIETALEFLNNPNVDPVVRVAVFHFLFGYIHPFYDGNGRTNRFISSEYLSMHLESVIGYGLSYTIKENIDRYYASFKETEHPKNMGDLTPFVISFCEIVADTAERIGNELAEKERLFKRYEKIAEYLAFTAGFKGAGKTDFVSILVQAALFSESGVSRKELAGYLGITRQTASKWLRTLNDAFPIKSTKVGKSVMLKADLKFLEGLLQEMDVKGL